MALGGVAGGHTYISSCSVSSSWPDGPAANPSTWVTYSSKLCLRPQPTNLSGLAVDTRSVPNQPNSDRQTHRLDLSRCKTTRCAPHLTSHQNVQQIVQQIRFGMHCVAQGSQHRTYLLAKAASGRVRSTMLAFSAPGQLRYAACTRWYRPSFFAMPSTLKLARIYCGMHRGARPYRRAPV
jgi:hypothetical protein